MRHRHKWVQHSAYPSRETYFCECGMMKERRLSYWVYLKNGRIVKRTQHRERR